MTRGTLGMLAILAGVSLGVLLSAWLLVRYAARPIVGRLFGLDSGFLNAQLHRLRTEASACWPENARSSAPNSMKKILAGNRNCTIASWGEITEAEIDLIRSVPVNHLRLRYCRLRDELTDLAGIRLAPSYLASIPVNPGAIEVEIFRAHCVDMLSQIQRLRALRRGFGRVRSYVTVFATLLAVFFCYMMVHHFVLVTATLQERSLFATTMLIFTGMLGGCVSALSRLYSVSWSDGVVTGTDGLGHLFCSLILNFILAVLEGGIFAVLLHLAFMGKIVSGVLFPAFQTGGSPYFHEFFEKGLVSHAEYAKALVWSFVAGFSERLVPDFLRTLGPNLKVSTKS